MCRHVDPPSKTWCELGPSRRLNISADLPIILQSRTYISDHVALSIAFSNMSQITWMSVQPSFSFSDLLAHVIIWSEMEANLSMVSLLIRPLTLHSIRLNQVRWVLVNLNGFLVPSVLRRLERHDRIEILHLVHVVIKARVMTHLKPCCFCSGALCLLRTCFCNGAPAPPWLAVPYIVLGQLLVYCILGVPLTEAAWLLLFFTTQFAVSTHHAEIAHAEEIAGTRLSEGRGIEA